MYLLAKIFQFLFPLIAMMLLISGMKRNKIYYVIAALWLSLIALLLHFQFTDNQIFGAYFDYTNASIYTLTLVILLFSLLYTFTHLSIGHPIFKHVASFVNSFLVVAALLLITNLWINAFFIANKKPGTPIMQVALFDKPQYCDYKYVFFKIAADNSVAYLCPNHYGLIASMGTLSVVPDFITKKAGISEKK